MNGARQVLYKYNGQGSLYKINNKMISMDTQDRVTEFRNKAYEYDSDGFLKSKGDVKYQFNSKGMYCA